MKWFILFFLALFLHISNGQEQKSENKKKVYNISFDESPAQADSAMRSNFDTILTKFNMELNPHSGFSKSSSIDLYKALTDYNMAEFRRITNKYDIMLKEEILKLQSAP